MKRCLLILTAVASLLGSAWLVWHAAQKPKDIPPAAKTDKTEQARLANIARQKKDGIVPAAKKASEVLGGEELRHTQQATPARGVSLLALDLSRPPTETELIRSGQLRGPLSPTGPADPKHFTDPAARARQERDNLLFGAAMQAWNDSRFDEALGLFQRHLVEHPESPWAGEGRLHLALAAQSRQLYDEANRQADAILAESPVGTDIYQKASLVRAETMVREGRHEEAAGAYLKAMRSETNGQRKKLAAGWLTTLSQYRKNRS